jgi:hypothetical protein
VNIRTCKLCGREVDFDEPYCAHETMEESAWLNMPKAVVIEDPRIPLQHFNDAVDEMVHQAAKELGWQAGETQKQQLREAFGGTTESNS